MTAEHQRELVIQTGPLTAPDSLLADLEIIDGIKLHTQRLGTWFRSGGVATFITVTTNSDQIAPLAEALFQHAQRLKTRGGDDLVFLLGGEIRSDAEMVSFQDVRCQRQISLREKSQEEIRLLLQGKAA